MQHVLRVGIHAHGRILTEPRWCAGAGVRSPLAAGRIGKQLPAEESRSAMRIYFCSDIHASRKCWKKFLNSWRFYDADHIMVGGDITGKFVVPIIRFGPNKYTATF
ncbi:MAG: hypothetical protein WAW53_05055, partial [Candidatus Dormiibacterota bacterium]